MKLEGGIGLSLINKVPEELVFASLTGINVHYTQLATSHMLELSIQDVQVSGEAQNLVFFFLPVEQLTRSAFNVLGTSKCSGANFLWLSKNHPMKRIIFTYICLY